MDITYYQPETQGIGTVSQPCRSSSNSCEPHFGQISIVSIDCHHSSHRPSPYHITVGRKVLSARFRPASPQHRSLLFPDLAVVRLLEDIPLSIFDVLFQGTPAVVRESVCIVFNFHRIALQSVLEPLDFKELVYVSSVVR